MSQGSMCWHSQWEAAFPMLDQFVGQFVGKGWEPPQRPFSLNG